MQLSDFLSLVQETQMQLELSKANVSPNALLKQIFDQLFKTNLAPLITQQRHKFNTFLSSNPNGVIYLEESVQSIVEYLLEGQAITTIKLIDSSPTGPDSESRLNVPSAYREAVSRHRNHSSFSKPTYAAMHSHSVTTAPTQTDASKTGHNETIPVIHDDSSVEEYTQEEKEQIERIIQPAYAALMTEFDDDANQQIYNDLFFSAMRRYRERQQCEACTGNHPVDECRARGWHFLDPVTQKRVQQVNARLEVTNQSILPNLQHLQKRPSTVLSSKSP
jgi:hypothetical protein